MKKDILSSRLSLLRRGCCFKKSAREVFVKALLSCTAALLFFGNAGLTEAYQLPDTGQTNCYNSSGTVVGCSTSGQDGQYSINPMSFADNLDGTIEDYNTGLIWQKCSAGQTNDTPCNGIPSDYNWYQASGTFNASHNTSSQNVCGTLNSSNFAGYQDWRLPSANELQTIVNYSIGNPAITVSYFPNTQANQYWSSSTDAYHPSYAWQVHFGTGRVSRGAYLGDGISPNYVRCVRGSQAAKSFTNTGLLTVHDNTTGLIWQKAGTTVTHAWAAALSYCADTTTGGQTDWRLPNIKELASLIDFSQPNLIDTNNFPDALSYFDYLSSTTDVFHLYDSWGVYFVNDGAFYGNGGVSLGYEKVSSLRYVRCVRGGQGSLDNFVRLMREDAPVNFYAKLQDAYHDAIDGDIIQAEAITMIYIEPLKFTSLSNAAVSLNGGYDNSFASVTGVTTLYGSLTIGGATTLTVGNLIIK
jgi:hypothetical protein